MGPLTCACFLLLLLGRLLLLALPLFLGIGISLFSRWSPPFPFHAPALILLFLAKVRLSLTLTLSPLTIWCFGLTGLFLFLLVRAALAYLPTAFSVASRPLSSFQLAQYAQVCLLKPKPFCKLFAGLGSTNKSATSLLLLSDSRSVLTALSSPPSFFFPQTLWQMWQELSFLSSCSIGLQWVPGHSFLSENDLADELARRGALLAPRQSLDSLLLPLVSTHLFSRIGDVLSHLNSSTHRFPRFPVRNLCSLVTLVVYSLVCAATDTAFY